MHNKDECTPDRNAREDNAHGQERYMPGKHARMKGTPARELQTGRTEVTEAGQRQQRLGRRTPKV